MNLVRQWVDALAADRVEEAQALLQPSEWLPDDVRAAIASYEPSNSTLGGVAQVTPMATARVADASRDFP